mgnify:FL=1
MKSSKKQKTVLDSSSSYNKKAGTTSNYSVNNSSCSNSDSCETDHHELPGEACTDDEHGRDGKAAAADENLNGICTPNNSCSNNNSSENNNSNLSARHYHRSKSPRLRWTPDLHHLFVQVVDLLGGEQSKRNNRKEGRGGLCLSLSQLFPQFRIQFISQSLIQHITFNIVLIKLL